MFYQNIDIIGKHAAWLGDVIWTITELRYTSTFATRKSNSLRYFISYAAKCQCSRPVHKVEGWNQNEHLSHPILSPPTWKSQSTLYIWTVRIITWVTDNLVTLSPPSLSHSLASDLSSHYFASSSTWNWIINNCRPNNTVVMCAVSYCTALSGASSIPMTSNSCLVHPLARCHWGS